MDRQSMIAIRTGLLMFVILARLPGLIQADDIPASRGPGNFKSSPIDKLLEDPAYSASREGLSLRKAMASESSFVSPEVVYSADGQMHLTLDVRYNDFQIGDDQVHLRSYNHRLVGPTMRVKPGTTLHIRLVNNIVPENNRFPSRAKRAGQMHAVDDPNVTNLHTHGLHVSPKGDSDNVFLKVHPTESQNYKIYIPSDHPPGTHWYHAHAHGTTAVQVSSSMSGAIIVEGGLDDVPEIRQMTERTFVFEQIPYAEIEGVNVVEDFDAFGTWPKVGDKLRFTTVNGQLLPVIEMAPGEIQRWRFIHAGIAETLRLAVDATGRSDTTPMSLYEIATDGIAFGTLEKSEFVELISGNRSDVLVQAPMSTGDFFLKDLATAAGESLQNKAEASNVIARIVVRGKPKPMRLPNSSGLRHLAPYPPVRDSEVNGRRSLLFYKFGAGTHVIDGREFDENRIDQYLRVGTAEEWILSSAGDSHPFHIHVNPFEVIWFDPKTGEERRRWKDTVLVREKNPIVMRTRYETIVGKTVLHCHRLDHEDQGMMQAIELISKDAVVPTAANSGREGPLPRPARVPAWRLPDARGVIHESTEFDKRPVVFVLFRGLGCLHCAEQLQAFVSKRKAMEEKGLTVVAISTGSSDELRKALEEYQKDAEMPFQLLADNELKVFRAFGCLRDEPLHGTFLVDGDGNIRWRHVGERPITNVEAVLKETDLNTAKSKKVN